MSCYTDDSDDECGSGAHHIYNTHICLSFSPSDHYYINGYDEYRPCHSSCEECDEPADSNSMNCKKCISGYYKIQGTKSCYPNGIDSYYLDSGVLKPCTDSNCLKCNSNNCQKCKSNYFLKPDNSCTDRIENKYYYDYHSQTLKECPSNCLRCLPSLTDESNIICVSCDTDYYMTEDTDSCEQGIINYYYLDKTLPTWKYRRCYPKCLKCNEPATSDNLMNCEECINNYYMTENTKSCYQGEIDNYYLDETESPPIYKKCYQNCLRCNASETSESHNCLSCKNNYYLTEDTNSCYDTILDNYYFDFDNRMLRRCHPNCFRCSGGPINDTYLNCIDCKYDYFITEDTNSCFNYQKENYYIDNSTYTLRRCFKNCNLCSDAPESYYLQNCITCKDDYYMTEDTHSCYRKPLENYYFDTNQFKKCNKNCLVCYKISNPETFRNCLHCYKDHYLTDDKNTCYNYIKNNVYNFYNLNDINQDIYFELPMDAHFVQFTTS